MRCGAVLCNTALSNSTFVTNEFVYMRGCDYEIESSFEEVSQIDFILIFQNIEMVKRGELPSEGRGVRGGERA